MRETALITGITGQSGALLSELLLKKGYRVAGTTRGTPDINLSRLKELGIAKDIELIHLDLTETDAISRTVEKFNPREIYNLAGQSSVGASFGNPVGAGDSGGLDLMRVLEAVRSVNPRARFFQASTAEMFGEADKATQSETAPFRPRSPYAAAKLYAHWITVIYRESYGMHASSGILFNHESPLRGQQFVTRKVTLSLARIKHGELDTLELGNLNIRRDWGYAGDYVEGMWRMLQHDAPGNYVLATGRAHSLREFIQCAGRAIGFDIVFEGSGLEERGIDRKSGRTVVRVSPEFFRPSDISELTGNAEKARHELGWRPQMPFIEIVNAMAEADDRRVRDGRVEF
jgi:GDPmannose 4,6-dehydratase